VADGLGVDGTVAEPDGAGLVPLGVGEGAMEVELEVGVGVCFLVFVGLGAWLGVVVCTGVTTTSGGGGGRTSRYTTSVTTKNAASAQVVGRIRRRAFTGPGALPC
jgi:hypothetical protein